MSITSLVSTIATLALLLASGFVAGKLKFVDEVSTERLSTLIIKIAQPFLIISSVINLEYTPENLKTGMKILVLGFCAHIVMAVVAYLLARPIKPLNERKLSEFAMLFANCGFVGFPILESLYGAEGLFYGAFYVLSFQIFVWTWGISIFARKREDIKITPKKIFINFGTTPCLIGFLIFVMNIELPGFIYEFSNYLGSLCTPVSLIISGANIARRSLKKMFTNKNVYYVCFVKLVVMSFVMSTILWLLGLPEYMIVFAAVMGAMPCPAVVTMFGELYRISPGYAAELVGASTVLSTATILPMVYYASFLASHPLVSLF
ncbi:MAG: AEC family transporter [Ruminococcaceae bacterium]|nr:AEC family transporter [Oscillospiraceae bacterium]